MATCATLLELKVSRLLPRHVEPDEEDLLGTSPDLLLRPAPGARRVPPGGPRRGPPVRGGRPVLRPGHRARARSSAHLYPDVMAKVTAEQPRRGRGRHAATRRRWSTCPTSRRSGRRCPRRWRGSSRPCETPRRLEVPRAGGRLPRSPSTWWCGSWRCSSCYNEGRVALRQAETFGEIEVEWEDA